MTNYPRGFLEDAQRYTQLEAIMRRTKTPKEAPFKDEENLSNRVIWKRKKESLK